MGDVQTMAGRALEYVERHTTRVRLITPSGIIEGDHAHPTGVRLSDSLRNAASERYMLLTNVSIKPLDGGTPSSDLGDVPFVLVSSAHASVIIPFED
jgi:hypothetical protein